ncbi:MAG: AraC family transcriptional regulator [Eubacteriales bacterium]|nr:AraC family transcriptional regulator [Eubacteriales bacterium]
MCPCAQLNDDRSERVPYTCPGYPIHVTKSRLCDYPNYTAPSHWHDDMEFIVVLSGQMDYSVNGTVVTLREGEGIVVNARQMHFGFSAARASCEFLCILLHPELLCSVSSLEQDFVLPVLQNGSAPFALLHPGCPWQERILKELFSMYDASLEGGAAPLKIQSSFAAVWALLYEHLPVQKTPSDYPGADLAIMKNMVGYIQKHYAEKLTLADIAAAGAVGQSKCCKLFQKYVQQTPVLYLNQHRLSKSVGLLRSTDLSVTEIALSVGFRSASYYAESFRKWCGKSPTAFKNELP